MHELEQIKLDWFDGPICCLARKQIRPIPQHTEPHLANK